MTLCAKWHYGSRMANTLNEQIAGTVRHLAAESGVPLARLIEATSIPERTFRRRLQGNSAWTTDELLVIAEHFDVPVSTLIRGSTHAA